MINDYRGQIKSLYVLRLDKDDAKREAESLITYLRERGAITVSQRDHLVKYSNSLYKL